MIEIRDKINQWISTLPKNLQERVRDNYFVAGGAIVSTILNEEVNDYDVWFSDPKLLKELLNYYLGVLYTFELRSNKLVVIDKPSYFIDHLDTNLIKTISYSALTLQNDIQIIFKNIGEPWLVINDFDFTHTKVWINNTTSYLPEDILKLIKKKELQYSGSKFAINTLMRVTKYTNKGWKIDYPYMFRIVNDVLSLTEEEQDKQRQYVMVSSSGENI